MKTKVI